MDTRDRQQAFLDRLILELRALSPWATEPLDTIFVGGGTPSLLHPSLWDHLLKTLHETFDLSRIDSGQAEFTVECNPETVTDHLLDILRGGGVNRISVGAQSFNPRHLKTLERWHDPESVPRSLDIARRAGIQRQSLDLIFAIPGQTLSDWEADLHLALSLGTEHLSCYNLTYEPNTAMTHRLSRGEFEPVPDELAAAMYETTVSTLRSRGYQRYEVSNFSLPGAEARHNLAYWRNLWWLAAGPSASAHVGGHRWKNIPRLGDYLAHSDRGFAPIQDHEPPDPRRALAEVIMLGLRLAEGLEIAPTLDAAAAIDLHAPARIMAEADAYAAVGDLMIRSGRWVLTDAGFLRADAVAGDFIQALG